MVYRFMYMQKRTLTLKNKGGTNSAILFNGYSRWNSSLFSFRAYTESFKELSLMKKIQCLKDFNQIKGKF